MVAAQPEQLAQAAPEHQHEGSCCSEPAGQNQAVGLDLLVPHELHAAGAGSGPAPDRLRYFNWDQRDTARAAMQTLVAALSEDPINSFFTGSSRRQKKFVKDEVGWSKGKTVQYRRMKGVWQGSESGLESWQQQSSVPAGHPGDRPSR